MRLRNARIFAVLALIFGLLWWFDPFGVWQSPEESDSTGIRNERAEGGRVVVSGAAETEARAGGTKSRHAWQFPYRGLVYSGEWSTAAEPVFSRFREWTARYRAEIPGRRVSIEAEGLALAKERRVAMRALITSDPERALALSVPASVRVGLPASVVAELEKRISGTGDYSVLASSMVREGSSEEATPNRMVRKVYLNGESYYSHVYGRREGQLSKQGASLHGIAIDREMALHESPVRVLDEGEVFSAGRVLQSQPSEPRWIEVHGRVEEVSSPAEIGIQERRHVAAEEAPGPVVPDVESIDAEITTSAGTKAAALATSWTTGSKNVLVIRVDFSDQPGESITEAAAYDLLNTSIRQYYEENSYGKTTLVPTVSSKVYRMPQTAAAYATADLTDELFAAATTAAGADYVVSNYTFVIVAFKYLSETLIPGSQFTWAGLGTVGGGKVWINGYFNFGTVTHELGHNYGLYHANLWKVSDGQTLSDGGTSLEYGDPFDIMGNTGTTRDLKYHMNGWFKNRMGWLPDEAVLPVSASGTYRVYRFDAAGANLAQPLALSIFRDGARDYWVGLRQLFTSNETMLNGAYVLWGYHRNHASELLDCTTPGTSSTDAALQVGATLSDAGYGISLRPALRAGVDPSQYLDVEVVISRPSKPIVTGWGSGTPATSIPSDLGVVKAIAAGASHALALMEDGTVRAWGSNTYGQATVPSGMSGVLGIAAGGNLSGVVKSDGTVVVWGDTANGVTTVPAGLSEVRQLALGSTHALALKSDGTVVAWGKAEYNQLSVPSGLTGVTSIAAGYGISLAVKPDGTMVRWGANYSGVSYPAPTGVAAVSAGRYHSLALKSDGTVEAWGSNDYGQSTVPSGLTGVVAVSAGGWHSLALKSDGSVVGWGSSSSEKLNTPRGMPTIKQLLAGDYCSMALVGGGVAPTISASPTAQVVSEGDALTLSVTAAGTAPFSYQWRKNGVDIVGATTASYVVSTVQLSHAGSYTVFVSNGTGSVVSSAAVVTVIPAGVAAKQFGSSGGYVAGGTATVLVTVSHDGAVSRLAVDMLLPTGWTFASGTGADSASTQPALGNSGTLGWVWTTVPASPVVFSVTLNVPVSQSGDASVVGSVSFTHSVAGLVSVMLKPDPLILSAGTFHSADTSHDSCIGVSELTRVIQLYNTRNGTSRTGCYLVQEGTVDGFAPAPERLSSEVVNLTRTHSADYSLDGKIGVSELTRVIQLYNTRSGTTRTGTYHIRRQSESASVDGFAPGI